VRRKSCDCQAEGRCIGLCDEIFDCATPIAKMDHALNATVPDREFLPGNQSAGCQLTG